MHNYTKEHGEKDRSEMMDGWDTGGETNGRQAEEARTIEKNEQRNEGKLACEQMEEWAAT